MTDVPRTDPSLSDRLRALMAERGASTRQISETSKLEIMQVHRIVVGKTINPGILTVQRIVEAFGASVGDLYPPKKKPRKIPKKEG